MAQRQEHASAEATDRPVIGLIATEDTTDQVVRATLRAVDRDYVVLVTHYNTPEIEAVRLVDRLGAQIVDPPVDNLTHEGLRHGLASTAREQSYPGIIFQPENGARIDYEQSVSQHNANEAFGIEAVGVKETTGVLAAIPAYNEAGTIKEVVTAAREYSDSVLVVDDGSTDATALLAREAGAVVVEHDSNSGYGAALQTIFEEAAKRKVAHLVILDADGQHDPSDIPTIVEVQQETEAEIVIGSRFTNDGAMNAPLYRRFGLFVVNTLTNLSFGVVRPQSWLSDTQSGFRAYNWRAIESLATENDLGDRMSASTDILYHAHHHNYDIREVGISVDYDVDDASSQHPLTHGITLVSNILKTVERERPITVLGAPGFFGSFVGLGFGYWTFANYIATGTFPIGLAITSAFFGLAGIFACFTAIILHSLNQQFDS